MSRQRARASDEKGYVLVGVLVVLVLLMLTLLVTLDEAGEGLRDAGRARQRELVHAATAEGLSLATAALSTMDAAAILAITPTSNNIFDNWATATPLTPAAPYPPAGSPYELEMSVTTGVVPGQRTRAPAGEDVRAAYGYIVNVQVSVRMEAVGAGAAAESRTEIGVRVPQIHAHSN